MGDEHSFESRKESSNGGRRKSWRVTTAKDDIKIENVCSLSLSAHSAYTIFGVEILSIEREREQYRIIQFRWLPVVVDDGFWE